MKTSVFLKGMLMGICDLVPGISGGTIAYVTGIYERLITSVKEVLHFTAITELLVVSVLFVVGRKKFKELDSLYKKYDIYFLCTLLLGIVVAIFAGSRIILYLLDDYFIYTMSFFVGLILASSILIFNTIEGHYVRNQIFGIYGLVLGLLLAFLLPITPEIDMFYVFISGLFGIFAMFLPGISGSYILYIMGSYEFILASLSNVDFSVLIVFLFGAILGAMAISRIVSVFLKRYHSKTLYFLLGFVIGALIIPVRDIYRHIYLFNEVILSGLFMCIGFLIVFIIEKSR